MKGKKIDDGLWIHLHFANQGKQLPTMARREHPILMVPTSLIELSQMKSSNQWYSPLKSVSSTYFSGHNSLEIFSLPHSLMVRRNSVSLEFSRTSIIYLLVTLRVHCWICIQRMRQTVCQSWSQLWQKSSNKRPYAHIDTIFLWNWL